MLLARREKRAAIHYIHIYLDFMAYSEREVVKVQYDETNEIRAPYSLSFILTKNN